MSANMNAYIAYVDDPHPRWLANVDDYADMQNLCQELCSHWNDNTPDIHVAFDPDLPGWVITIEKLRP